MKPISKALVAASAAVILVLTSAVSGASARPLPPPSTLTIPCEKVAAGSDMRAAFTTPMSVRNPAISEFLGFSQVMPRADVIRAAGGTVCEFSNGERWAGGPDGVWKGLRLTFLHGAADAYYHELDVIGEPRTIERFGCYAVECFYSTAVGGDWLDVQIIDARSDADALSLGRRISAVIQLVREGTWAPTASKHPLGTTCEEVLPAKAFQNAVASPYSLYYYDSPSWLSPWNEAIDRAQAPYCWFLTADGAAGPGQLRTLPSGAWGFEELSSLMTEPGPLTRFTRVALPHGDLAYIRCSPTRDDCILDAILADHWIQVELWPIEPGIGIRTIFRDREDALVDILEALVDRVYR
jgi:hypothetical protein